MIEFPCAGLKTVLQIGHQHVPVELRICSLMPLLGVIDDGSSIKGPGRVVVIRWCIQSWALKSSLGCIGSSIGGQRLQEGICMSCHIIWGWGVGSTLSPWTGSALSPWASVLIVMHLTVRCEGGHSACLGLVQCHRPFQCRQNWSSGRLDLPHL